MNGFVRCPFLSQASLQPVQVLQYGAEEEKAETARLVGSARALSRMHCLLDCRYIVVYIVHVREGGKGGGELYVAEVKRGTALFNG